VSNTSVKAYSTSKANKTSEANKTVDAKENQTEETQNVKKEKHSMSYYLEQVNHVESGNTEKQEKKNATTVVQPKVKSLETLAKEQAQEEEKKK